MRAGAGPGRRHGGTAAGLFGASLLVAATVLGAGGASALPSAPPAGSASPGGPGAGGNTRGGQDEGNGRRGENRGDKENRGEKGDRGDQGDRGDRGEESGRPGSPGSSSARPGTAPPSTTASAPPAPASPSASATASAPTSATASAKPSAVARPAPAGAVLAAAEAGPGAGLPTAQGLQQALATVLTDQNLGTVGLAVADAADGRLLYGKGENTAATPASTTKLATSVAALSLIPGDTRLVTRVVKSAATGGITLVGGGDPTLTALPADQVQIAGVPADPDTAPASLDALARQTAAALKAAGTTTVVLDYDVSLYTGPLLHKNHDGENIAAVTPLMVDEGKADPKSLADAPARVADPAGAAAEAFANLLKAQGVTVQGKAKAAAAPAAADAPVLGRVDSPTMARLVERMLTTSDNTLAEAIARQAAIAAHQPAAFEGAATAVTQELARLGVPMTGVVLNDGSGLHPGNAIPPAVLVGLLGLAASAQHPTLRPVLTGLPIAGFTGTLGKRFGAGSGAADAAGLVRAKTGSLSGVNTLAGTVVDADGRLLAFALMTRTGAPVDTARAAMDRVVARLAACGCR
ncbi:D-alanyl-D-alanine carboxypeptidase / D-alanyl-D-alanine-endopeptidase (penicillin-binding protein 4) [Streptomyces sp. TLI_053]|uniref:D-alanyl-D-alanine carboxypeptidase/D-alanyl-D-alanine endopeptidase n=1 Tax=Streptomyces sp. TLI_053 TaxID=1855352 RepID=UPI00087A29E4|nr:D-alanyl-D-alanine carboxypeptidase/D-alanyl-D-alanine-endopeptidase [Streptomyces sp. TLI_053]SDT72927.1 D-alanyl-D-alanine carboxypeptidase / D-alanyl-D-alanine-endopeptidase (penicillin-binding protein 4) [Streptomyces sp. TLI_053]